MGLNLEQRTGAESVSSRRLSATSPTASAHLAEIADILAAGLMRSVARKSSQISPVSAENSLDISPTKSGHAPSAQRSIADVG